MRSFRERNPLPLGIAGLATAGLAAALAFNLQYFAGGTTYSAAFSEAGGLKPGEEVRIAGVKVGKVDSVDLDGDHVKVRFTSSTPFGTQTRAQIKIKTILGSHYIALDPKGAHRQPTSQEIPISRTIAPYNVVPALQDASAAVGKIDTRQLATAMDTLSQTMQGSPQNLRRTLDGLQKISEAVSSRDDELNDLLKHSRNITSMLAARTGDLAVLVRNSGLLLQEINDRRVVINQLLTGTVALSQQITGTIQENKATIGPMLNNLHRTIDILRRNQGNLEKAFATMGQFTTEYADLTGTGRWFDVYVQNLLPLPSSLAPPAARNPTGLQPGSGPPSPAPQPGKGTTSSPRTGRGTPNPTGSTPPGPAHGGGPLPIIP